MHQSEHLHTNLVFFLNFTRVCVLSVCVCCLFVRESQTMSNCLICIMVLSIDDIYTHLIKFLWNDFDCDPGEEVVCDRFCIWRK